MAVTLPACAPATTFWLEVYGKDCLEGHDYILSEAAADGHKTIALENCSDCTGRKGPIQAGHVEDEATRSLSLILRGDEQVVVPLIQDEPIGPRKLRPPQKEYQENLMVAIHPTLFCDATELLQERPLFRYGECLEAPLRTGWLYIFFRGRLWRELFVESSEDTAPLMRDTALSAIREASGDRNERPPVGPRVDTVHMPAYLLGQPVYGDLQLAFSDSQWSWQHIRDLEENHELRKARCRDGGDLRKLLHGIAAGISNGWRFIDHMIPMRGRDNVIESDVPYPNRWLQDLEGERTAAEQEALIRQREAIESSEYTVDADLDIRVDNLFPAWRLLHRQGESVPETAPGNDVLDSLRDRHIGSLTLRDPLFAARHLVRQMNHSLMLMLALVDNVKKRPHGVTAEVFHNNFRRAVLPDGSKNPLYTRDQGWLDDRLDESDEGLLLRTLYCAERAALRRFMLPAQAALARLVEDESPGNLTVVLRDLFNMEAGNDSAGYVQASPLLQMLALPAGQIDPLMLPQEFEQVAAPEAQRLNQALLLGHHPLAQMLLPHNSPDQAEPGDATTDKLKATLAALEDHRQPMRLVEANALRSLEEHLDRSDDPTVDELLSDYRYGSHALHGPLSDISQWWLGGIQKLLDEKGKTVVVDVDRIKGAFEGFAAGIVPGSTKIQLNDTPDGKAYVAIAVVDEQGKTLTSAASAASAIKLAEEVPFKEVVKNRPLGLLHKGVVSPMGLPAVLVVFDLHNLINAARYEADSFRKIVGIISAIADLSISAGQLLTLWPGQASWLDRAIINWSREANWFTSLADRVNSENRNARAVVRTKLQAAGWVAGMVTASLFVWDALADTLEGRINMAGADLTKAVGVGIVANSDIIAARILTPIGERFVERSAIWAAARGISVRVASRVGFSGMIIPTWGGQIVGGWVTLLGAGVFLLGEMMYYRFKDDAITEWLRSGPFSGDEDDRVPELQDERTAYLEMIKTMTGVSLRRISGRETDEVLEANGLSGWKGLTESVLVFSSPAFAITGEPADIELELTYDRKHYEIMGPNPHAGTMMTREIARKQGRIQPIAQSFDDRQTVLFVIDKMNLPEMTPASSRERIETHYQVRSLKLTYTVTVWDRQAEAYEDREVTQTLTDLDIDRYDRH